MKISIITVSHNSAETIRKTIESVLRQSHPEVEYIVVDGDSDDGTQAIIASYESRFGERMRWISEPDGGIYHAMNKGIAMASGEVIGCLNSDDYYASPSVLERVAAVFEEKTIDAVFSDLKFVSKGGKQVIRYWKGSPYYPDAFAKGWHPAHPTFFVRKNIYKRYGTFDTAFSVSADFELMLRLIEKEKIKTEYIPDTLVYMRYGGESTRSLANILKGNKNIKKAFRKNGIKLCFGLYFLNRMINKVKQFSNKG